jgi:sterol desaturase/sphingolipid hydroxylase (fatty acid hydroxylase superfamily)
MDSVNDTVWRVCCAAGFSLSPMFWLPVAVLSLVFWLSMGRGKGLREFLNWDGVLTHRSTRTDLWLFLINRGMTALGVITYFTFAPLAARVVVEHSLLPPLFGNGLSPLALALVIFVIYDFAHYWSHRIFHRSALWSLHAVHHSAEVLTPLTTYRVHPLAALISAAFHSVVLGVGMGLVVGALAPDMGFAEIAGANAVVVLLNATIVNLHHSQMHVSFGPIVERILISPAQHQIHHSRDPRHFNRNYGNVLAIWDWMFGTLYLVREKEELHFGLDGAAEAALMTQRLWPMLVDPIRRLIP